MRQFRRLINGGGGNRTSKTENMTVVSACVFTYEAVHATSISRVEEFTQENLYSVCCPLRAGPLGQRVN
jgi:hypothetical protein